MRATTFSENSSLHLAKMKDFNVLKIRKYDMTKL